jgi:hypothetical protein
MKNATDSCNRGATTITKLLLKLLSTRLVEFFLLKYKNEGSTHKRSSPHHQ